MSLRSLINIMGFESQVRLEHRPTHQPSETNVGDGDAASEQERVERGKIGEVAEGDVVDRVAATIQVQMPQPRTGPRNGLNVHAADGCRSVRQRKIELRELNNGRQQRVDALVIARQGVRQREACARPRRCHLKVSWCRADKCLLITVAINATHPPSILEDGDVACATVEVGTR